MINALEAGLDCIEHAEFLIPGKVVEYGGGISSSGIMEYDPAVAERFASQGTFISYTFQAGGYDSLVELRAKAGHERLTPDETARRDALESYYDMKLEIFRRLLGDRMHPYLVVSSDAGPFDCEFGRMHYGLELAVQAGMSPLQAIEAATSIAARACGVADLVGSLEPGKEADLLVVHGNAACRRPADGRRRRRLQGAASRSASCPPTRSCRRRPGCRDRGALLGHRVETAGWPTSVTGPSIDTRRLEPPLILARYRRTRERARRARSGEPVGSLSHPDHPLRREIRRESRRRPAARPDENARMSYVPSDRPVGPIDRCRRRSDSTSVTSPICAATGPRSPLPIELQAGVEPSENGCPEEDVATSERSRRRAGLRAMRQTRKGRSG